MLLMPANINPIYFVSPVVIILITAALLFYYRKKGKLPLIILGYSFLAYFGAIALKEVVQIPTYSYVVGSPPWVLGLYFGLQTVVFEIGLAYLIAVFVVSRKSLRIEHAQGYGAALAFWENGILLGAITLVNLIVAYVIIAVGPAAAAHAIYSSMFASEPALFNQVSLPVLLSILLGMLERVSSIILHFAWGYLVVVAAVLKKKKYLLIALPMGLVDVLVPYASTMPLWVFESMVFVISIVALAIALKVKKDISKSTARKTSFNTL